MYDNGWQEWSKHVLAELKRLSDSYDKLDSKFDEQFNKLSVEIAKLKVKAGVWGMLGGALPVVIGLLIWLLQSKAGG